MRHPNSITKYLSFYICHFLLLVTTSPLLGYEAEIVVKTFPLWESPKCAEKLYANNQSTPLWHFNGTTYFVFIDDDLRPFVAQVKEGSTEIVPLDPDPQYKVRNDGHHRFSLGIDSEGYIHITGDMHNYTNKLTSPYLPKYQKQTILYWKSVQPEDVLQGFEFVGNGDTAIPATGFTYGRFFSDEDGDLYYSSRIKAIDQRHESGEMGLGLFRYDLPTKKWAAIGGRPEDNRKGVYYDTLLWENAGMATGGWYQGFITTLKFDKKNILHMAASLNTDPTLKGNTALVYAKSYDKGLTWQRNDGSAISHLPLRGQAGLTNQADIVRWVDTPRILDSRVHVMADKYGNPGIFNYRTFYIGSPQGWDASDHPFLLATTTDIDNEENLVLTANEVARLMLADSYDDTPLAYDFVGFDAYESLDSATLKKEGVLYGIGINRNDQTQTILKTVITKAPLPTGWKGINIGADQLVYLGTHGFYDQKFFVNNYGIRINSTPESFHYLYKEWTGNGSIKAKIAIVGSHLHSRAGVMIRDSLKPDAVNVNVLLAPNEEGAVFGFLNPENGRMENINVKDVHQAPWVKLTREGNRFTGYISTDGVEFTKIGERTIDLPETIYIGLASASYHYKKMQQVTFEHVEIYPH